MSEIRISYKNFNCFAGSAPLFGPIVYIQMEGLLQQSGIFLETPYGREGGRVCFAFQVSDAQRQSKSCWIKKILAECLLVVYRRWYSSDQFYLCFWWCRCGSNDQFCLCFLYVRKSDFLESYFI